MLFEQKCIPVDAYCPRTCLPQENQYLTLSIWRQTPQKEHGAKQEVTLSPLEGTWDQTGIVPPGQTNRCKIITFTQVRMQAVMNNRVQSALRYHIAVSASFSMLLWNIVTPGNNLYHLKIVCSVFEV